MSRFRFEDRIYIPLPSAEIRRDKFLHCIKSTPNELTEEDYDVLVARTEGYVLTSRLPSKSARAKHLR